MKLIPDLREFLELLNAANVRYVIVGAWAFNFHAHPRATGDIDLFVASDLDNQKRIRSVLERFGFGSALPPPNHSLFESKKILMLGRQPNRVDLITEIDGVTFDEAWSTKISSKLDGIPVYFISKEMLVKNKRSTKRLKDKADVEALENE